MLSTNQNSNSNDAENRSSSPTRKRSKVSRACDACRRKKVRCDAFFNKQSNRLEKTCTNCQRNNEVCSFQRTPLKRGPTKGYSRMIYNNNNGSSSSIANITSPSSPSMNVDESPTVSTFTNPSAPMTMVPIAPAPPATNSSLVFPSSSSSSNSSSGNVTLPSIHTITSPMKSYSSNDNNNTARGLNNSTINAPKPIISTSNSNRLPSFSSSPSPSQPSPSLSPFHSRANSDIHPSGPLQLPPPPTSSTSNRSSLSNILNPPIPFNSSQQNSGGDLFWKVPYTSSNQWKNSTDSLSSSFSDKNTTNNYDASVASDSDNEEYRSAVSQYYISSNSTTRTPASPANSYSSLSSINNNISRNLNINNNNDSNEEPSPKLSPKSQLSPIIKTNINQTTNFQLEYNLTFYYKLIHKNFPILPLGREDFDNWISKIPNSAENGVIIDVFNKILQILISVIKKEDINVLNPGSISNNNDLNLNNRVLLIKDILHPLLIQIFQISPTISRRQQYQKEFSLFHHSNILLLITLNLANYLVVNSGENFFLSFNLTYSILIDLNIHKSLDSLMENLINSINNKTITTNDGFKLMYIKLLINSMVLENIFCLSFGVPSIFNSIDLNPNIIEFIYYNEISKPLNEALSSSLNHFKGGLILKKINNSIIQRFGNDNNIEEINYSQRLDRLNLKKFDLFKSKEISNYSNNGKIKDITTNFLLLIEYRFTLIDYLKKIRNFEPKINDNGILRIQDYQGQLGQICSKLLFKIIDLLSIITENFSEFQSLSPPLIRSLNKNLLIQSPLIPLIFKQSIILTNIIKMIINSMGFNEDFSMNNQEGFKTLKIFDDDISMIFNNYLPLIKPFNDSNNYGITNNEFIKNDFTIDIGEMIFFNNNLINLSPTNSIINNYSSSPITSNNSNFNNKNNFSLFLEKFETSFNQFKIINYKFKDTMIDKNFIRKFEIWKFFIKDIEFYLRNEDLEGWLLK